MTTYFDFAIKVNKIWKQYSNLVIDDDSITLNSYKIIIFPNGDITNIVMELDFTTSDDFVNHPEILLSIPLNIENPVQSETTMKKTTAGNKSFASVIIEVTPGSDPGEINEGDDLVTLSAFPFVKSSNYVIHSQFFYETKL